MAEWSNAAVLKTVRAVRLSGVRIPLPPPVSNTDYMAAKSKLLRMDNVGIVVESLDRAVAFFTELGLKLEGRAMVEGEWAGHVTGLGDQSVEVAMMVTPDGHNRIELSR